jgi:hypothetical protein
MIAVQRRSAAIVRVIVTPLSLAHNEPRTRSPPRRQQPGQASRSEGASPLPTPPGLPALDRAGVIDPRPFGLGCPCGATQRGVGKTAASAPRARPGGASNASPRAGQPPCPFWVCPTGKPKPKGLVSRTPARVEGRGAPPGVWGGAPISPVALLAGEAGHLDAAFFEGPGDAELFACPDDCGEAGGFA